MLRKYRKAKGNRFFHTLVCSLNIYMILGIFFVFAWCLGTEKMWEIGFFSLICLVSKKTLRDICLILVFFFFYSIFYVENRVCVGCFSC